MRILRPRALKLGSKIGIIAPASAPADLKQLSAGVKYLTKKGYDIDFMPEIAPRGYLAAPDEARITSLNAALRRDDLDALISVRGGYGVTRILDQVDYAAIRLNPKLIIGYSDLTGLHLAVYRHAGVVGLSGPMVAVEWNDMPPAEEKLFDQCVSATEPWEVIGPAGEKLDPVKAGSAEGVLLGGNLTLFASLLGTKWMPDLTGAILFLEEIGESPYKLDGLLTRLRLHGVFDKISGLVLGGITECKKHRKESLSLEEVLIDHTYNLPFPVASGLTYGHFSPKNSLPIGVQARLEVDWGNVKSGAQLTILESIFS